MTETVEKERFGFQAEVNQLLQLMIHSLYSNKEIFLRELISNASDAQDKLRFEAVSQDALYEKDSDLRIFVEADKSQGMLTIRDNGIGMSREEVIEHLGTIAKSGTKEFVSKLTEDQSKSTEVSQLIGQFGVGFYSAFMVADTVTVKTRRAGLRPDQGVMWESTGEGEYTLENIELEKRGTEITLKLKEEAKEFLDEWRLRQVIRQYSDHIAQPIMLVTQPEDGEGETTEEQVNNATALWTRAKGDITDEQYQEFYKHISHDYEDSLAWTHNRVEGKTEFTNLLFIPKNPPFDLFNRERREGVKLYVRRVFIMDDAEHLMPGYLRFVRGVIDSNDLPLNVSRELLQSNRVVDSIRSSSVRKILSLLETMQKNDPEKYTLFWNAFGRVMKEGPAEDASNKEKIAKLLRFSSTQDDQEAQTVTLMDYIERMKEGQEKIYYVTADSFSAAKNSPHLEVFRKKGIEVLLLSDPVDEWLVSHLTEFDGKSLQSVAKGALEFGDSEEEKKEQEALEKNHADLVGRVKDALGDRVKEVRVTQRLVDSPTCIVADENDLSAHMQRILNAAGQQMPASKPILELNPSHPLVLRLEEKKEAAFDEMAQLLLEQAILAEGGALDDPARFVKRMNAMLV